MTASSSPSTLLTPSDCAVLIVDPQPGLAFAVQSLDRQLLLNNLIAVAKTARAFSLPLIVSTSASRIYSGPMFAALREHIADVAPLERKNMNAWEDAAVKAAVLGTGRKVLLVAGLLTEACVSFPAIDAVEAGFQVYCIADACGGATQESHRLALERMRDCGVQMTSWLQVLLELQRDWTRHETYDAARAVVEHHAGGYGIGLAYARDMIGAPAAPSSVAAASRP
jgi:nicotinamidase-related amidase